MLNRVRAMGIMVVTLLGLQVGCPATSVGGVPMLSTAAQWTEATIPVGEPVGIAAGNGRLFVTDAATKEVVALRLDTGKVDKRITLALAAPKGLAFDGTLLWVADEKTRRIQALSPTTGKIVREIPLDAPPEKGYHSVGGLTWDGSHLWTAIAAGFSSSFNQIDSSNGHIERSLFADCDPRGLVSDGSTLWSLCFNGAQLPASLDRRDLTGDEVAFQRSRKVVGKVEGPMPSAVLLDGQQLWLLRGSDKRLTVFPIDQTGSPVPH